MARLLITVTKHLREEREHGFALQAPYVVTKQSTNLLRWLAAMCGARVVTCRRMAIESQPPADRHVCDLFGRVGDGSHYAELRTAVNRRRCGSLVLLAEWYTHQLVLRRTVFYRESRMLYSTGTFDVTLWGLRSCHSS